MTEIDDIQSFIAAQKKRIEEERSGLVLANVGRRNVGDHNSNPPKITQETSTNIQRPEQPKATVQEASSPRGLAFGEYENVQDRLKKERADEYKKFLAQKSYRSTGVDTPRYQPEEKSFLKSALRKTDNIQESPRDHRRLPVTPTPTLNTQVNGQQRGPLNDMPREPRRPRGRATDKTYEELYDAYEELLERKRQDERRYRPGLIDDKYSDARRVRFDDDSRLGKLHADTWLEHGRRRGSWDIPDNQDRGKDRDYEVAQTSNDYQNNSAPMQNANPDRISRSAPLHAVPLLGEHHMSPDVKQGRQTKYREELQAQIKEKEMQKKREKNHVFVGDQHNEDRGRNLPSNPSPQGYLTGGLPRPQDNPSPATHLDFNQPYDNPYMQRQPYNYPAGSLAGGALPPTLNGYPMQFREPVGGYQPSWANGPVQPQQTHGLVTSQGGIEAGGSTENRHGQIAGVEKNKYGDFGAHVGVLPYHETNKDQDRSRQQSYREELTRQMMEKDMRKKKDKEAVERYEMKLEKEIAEYDPWGKSGGGAPLKDESGRLVSDLRRMHQYNKEGTIISPRDHGAKPELYLNKENVGPPSDNTSSPVSLLDSIRQPIQTNDPQKNAKLEYQEYLRQQVEEKQKKKKEEEDRIREIDAREDEIIKEQQMKLQNEYEKEINATKKKEEAARMVNEKIRETADQKKKELEQKRLEEDKKQEESLRKQLDERLKAAKAKEVRSSSPPIPTMQRTSSPPIPTLQNQTRSNSPPIPTLQNQTRSNSPPIPTLQRNKKSEQPSEPVSRGDILRQTSVERDTSTPSSNSTSRGRRQTDHAAPSLPATPNNLTQHDQDTADIDVLSQLTSLRRQLKHEEIKVKQQLTENKEKYVQMRENSGSRRSKKPIGNVFDNVLRKTPGVSQRDQDMKSFGAMEEFNNIKYEDTSSLHGDFISRYPDPATSSSTLELQQQSLIKEQQRRLQVFRDRLLTNDKENVESLGNRTRPDSKTSQLESDSQFVSVEDPSKIVVEQGETSKQSARVPSARERRRWKQMEQVVKGSKLTDYKPPTPGGFSLNSVTSFNVDEIAQKNEERLRRLETLKQARSENQGDPNEVLKKFIQKHSRPDSKVSEKSLPADKQHLPNM